ncbi:hypothetical protein RND71_010589 [Anisodus tanguticus]|uniref:Uncharacterized protein n=1 Tax=Anisodus tanguticus TaxID=243964 RepID=A0AAE1SI13_9SOLA|nr:hypothetical protein RND71_010589 [Anisodus tanguticus]
MNKIIFENRNITRDDTCTPINLTGTISDMVKDVSRGISFVCNNIDKYGGDLAFSHD